MRKSSYKWNDNRDLQLEGMVDSHRTLAFMAGRLHTDTTVILRRLHTIGLDPAHTHCYSLRAFEDLLMVDHDTVMRWINDEKWITAYPTGYANGLRVIDTKDVLNFLTDERTWMAWVPDHMSDPDLQTYARQARGNTRYYTTLETSKIVGYSAESIRRKQRDGVIRSVVYHHRTYFRDTWIEDFLRLPDTPRAPITPYRQIPPEDIEFIKTWRPFQSIKDLAIAIERPYPTILRFCRRHTLEGPFFTPRGELIHSSASGVTWKKEKRSGEPS